MKDEFGAKDPKSHDAALPHPDRRRAADRAAARGQPRPGRAPGARRRCSAARSRCTPTPSTRRSRCRREKAARLALRTQQVIAYETDVTEDRRPVRRLVRRRVDDRRDRGGGARADAAGRGLGRRRRGHRAGLPEERDRALRVPRRAARSTPASAPSSASTGSPSTQEEPLRAAARRPDDRGGAARAARGPARRPRQRRRHGSARTPPGGRRAAPTTCSTR